MPAAYRVCQIPSTICLYFRTLCWARHVTQAWERTSTVTNKVILFWIPFGTNAEVPGMICFVLLGKKHVSFVLTHMMFDARYPQVLNSNLSLSGYSYICPESTPHIGTIWWRTRSPRAVVCKGSVRVNSIDQPVRGTSQSLQQPVSHENTDVACLVLHVSCSTFDPAWSQTQSSVQMKREK